MQNYFKNKKIVITGAASGIGADLVQVLSDYTTNLALIDIQEINSNFLSYKTDVTDTIKMGEVISDIINKWGYVDIVIAAAGVGGLNPGGNFSIELDQKIMQINYFGTVNTLIPFINTMKNRRSGQLVGICSLAGLRGLPSAASYSSSKAAQMTFLESLRLDLKKFNVTVSCLHPGFVKTPMASHSEFDMPFTISPRKASLIILNSIMKKKSQVYFPWPMGLLSRLNRILPNWIYDILLPRVGKVNTDKPKIFSSGIK